MRSTKNFYILILLLRSENCVENQKFSVKIHIYLDFSVLLSLDFFFNLFSFSGLLVVLGFLLGGGVQSAKSSVNRSCYDSQYNVHVYIITAVEVTFKTFKKN